MICPNVALMIKSVQFRSPEKRPEMGAEECKSLRNAVRFHVLQRDVCRKPGETVAYNTGLKESLHQAQKILFGSPTWSNMLEKHVLEPDTGMPASMGYIMVLH